MAENYTLKYTGKQIDDLLDKTVTLENYDDSAVKADISAVTNEVINARGDYPDLNTRISEIAVANKPVLSKTTAEWNSTPTLIAQKDVVYVYTDYKIVDGQKIAALKVGDGTSALIDMAFVASGTITEEERNFWNNKVSAYMSDTDETTLILSTH